MSTDRFIDDAGNVWLAEVDAQGNPIPGTERPASSGDGGGVVLPEPPAKPVPPPPRTAAGSATEGLKPGFMWIDPSRPSLGQVPIPVNERAAAPARPEFTATQKKEALDAFQKALTLDKQLAELRSLFERGPGSTSGIEGVRDFLPLEVNKRFDDAGNSLRATLRDVMGFTGTELNRPEEVEANIGPYIPQSSEYDAKNVDRLNRIARARDNALAKAIYILGGVPNEKGQIVPLPEGAEPTIETIRALTEGEKEKVSAFDVVRTNPETQPLEAVPFGQGGNQAVPYPKEMLVRHDDLVNRLISEGNGRLDPARYAQERAKLDQAFGFKPDTQSYGAWAQGVNQYLEAGGRTVPTGIQPVERVMSMTDTLRNSAINNPLSAAAVGAANSLGAGAVEALAPDQFAALRDAQAFPTLGGEVVGAVGATSGIGALGRMAARRLAPNLLRDTGRAQFARNVATDAAYGTAYGGVTQGNPIEGAALGVIGSVGGQGLARGLGAAVGGARITEAARKLKERGIPLSVGRQIGAGRAEDLAASLPGVGHMVRARQLDSLNGFNREMLGELGSPIGFAPDVIGREGVDAFKDAVGQAYGDAVSGVNAPLDMAFLRDLVPVKRMAAGMSQKNRRQLADTLKDAVQVPADAGQITPQQFQDAMSALKALRANPSGAMPNSAQTLRKASTQVIDALQNAMKRAGGEDVVIGLERANLANKGFKVAENAILDKAKVGSQSDINVAMPAQWLAALRQSERKYGGLQGARELAEAAQQVLPGKVANSGTTDRAIAAGGLGALGIGGTNEYLSEGNLNDTQSNAFKVAALLAAASLLGTRGGQRGIEKVLIDRPQFAKNWGNFIRRRAGLFGSASVPVALDYQE